MWIVFHDSGVVAVTFMCVGWLLVGHWFLDSLLDVELIMCDLWLFRGCGRVVVVSMFVGCLVYLASLSGMCVFFGLPSTTYN